MMLLSGFSRTKARELFSIPDRFDPVAMIALGYVGDLGSLPAQLRNEATVPRRRRPCKSWVFTETWGRPWPLVG